MTGPVYKGLLSAAISLCGACITTSLPKTPMQGGPAWQEITTEHFIIDTDLDATEVSAIASQLENTRRVLTQVVRLPGATKGHLAAARASASL
jgi:hypothetical protein